VKKSRLSFLIPTGESKRSVVMMSSGIRIGAWEALDWARVEPTEPITKDGVIVAARLKVYPGDREQYSTFSAEAYRAVQEYMGFRELVGEKVYAAPGGAKGRQ
jgi:hypothetical protein